MTVLGYFRAVAAFWRSAIALFLLGLGVASLLAVTLPRQYSATATLYISAQGDTNSTVGAYQGGLLSEQRVKSYTELLNSPRIAERAISDLRLPISITEMQDKISASTQPDTVLLFATATDGSPQTAAEIANSVARTFSQLVVELEQPTDPTRPPSVAARIVQPAGPPDSYVFPNIPLLLVSGAIVGLIAGIATALVRNSLDTSVKSRDELKEISYAPVLGTIEYDKDFASDPLVILRRPDSIVAEAFRRVRTNLQYVDIGQAQKVIAISSSIASEGKSSLVANLALSIAASGARVLVVEGDLRRPQVASYLNLNSDVGLTSVLIGRIGAVAAVQSRADGVDVVASGPLPPNPSELVGSDQMDKFIGEMRHRYDVVLVDAPPLLPVADASALATKCDGVLLICRHGKTTRSELAASVERVSAVSGRILGCVLTMAPSSRSVGAYTSYGYYSANSHRNSHSTASAGEPSSSETTTNMPRPSPVRRRG